MAKRISPMSADEMPLDVRALLAEHIETHEQLATVLLMRSDPERSWTTEALAEKLKTRESIAEETLQHLASRQLVACTEQRPRQYKYGPGPELSQVLDQLAEAHDTHWLGIMNLITENAIARARGSVADAFANAFVLRPRKEPDRNG
jgi:hypothetical protein